MREHAILRGWVLTILGGFHYGYHVGVVAAAASGIAEHMGEDLQSIEVASALALAGAIVGSPLSGVICELFGRRVGTVVGETIGLLGALCCAGASGYAWIWVGRLLVGLGIGFCTLAKPLYIQETVDGPAGRPILAGFAPAVAAGVLLSKASGALHWRVAFALGALPAVSLLSVAAFWMPESPAWLRARADSRAVSAGRPVSVRACDMRGLVLAVTLGLANQATGSYAYIVYSDMLFHSARAELFTMIVAVSSVLGALLVVPLMSCCRSRVLMVGGLLLMASLSLASSGVGVGLLPLPPLVAEVVIVLLSASWSFAYQVGPGGGYYATIVYLGDDQTRALFTAVGNSVRYAAELASSLCLYSVVEAVGLPSALGFYGTISLGCAALLGCLLPEMSARSAKISASAAAPRKEPVLRLL